MILFVNGCVRENSRTLELAQAVLARLEGEVQTAALYQNGAEGLTAETLHLREELAARKEFDHPMFCRAAQFARADTVVIAAPYWDLMFPARVRAYLEEITVSGITFRYTDQGIPQGLCRAKRLIYVTTSGGPIFRNFGFDYVKALAQGFYGIQDVRLVSAEGLDIWGADTAGILAQAKAGIGDILA